jgi:hypothetical protein
VYWIWMVSFFLASSRMMVYTSEMGSSPLRRVSSSCRLILDICISRSASSTSLCCTARENRSRANACTPRWRNVSGGGCNGCRRETEVQQTGLLDDRRHVHVLRNGRYGRDERCCWRAGQRETMQQTESVFYSTPQEDRSSANACQSRQ